MRKIVWLGGGLIVLLGVLVALAFLVDFDSPRLGKALLDEVSAQTGLHIEADGFRLNLVRGLRLDGVRFTTDGPSGRLTVQAASLLAEHRLAPLLHRRVEIDRIVLDQPRIELVTPPEGTPVARPAPAARPVPAPTVAAASAPSQAPAEATVPNGPLLAVDRIWVRNGTLATRTEGAEAPDVEIRGLNVELRDLALEDAPTALQGLHAGGDLHTGEILFGGLRATEGSGKLRLADGHFRLEEFGLKLPQGRFLLGEFDADLNRDPFAYRLALRVDPLDANAVLAAGPGGGFGPGLLVFGANGTGTETRDMSGDGTLSLAAGRLPGSPLFTAMEAVLGRAALKGSAYEPVTVPFRIRENRLHISSFELRTSLLSLGISGWADLAGPLDLKIAVRAPRDAVALVRVPGEILDLVADEGWVTVPLRVTGTPDAPRVTADEEALRAQGKRAASTIVRQQVERGVSRVLGKLFGHH
ncbi:MAG TPA: AsmA-like C-terminal region-containing protein [Thermoanaerobaculia bacterium]|nr:AsmA-like C-terminal region-containing protein [Thermoanaerobaculia bacterium]